MADRIERRKGVNVFAEINAAIQGINKKVQLIWQLKQVVDDLTDKVEYPRLLGVPDLSATVMREKAFQLGCVHCHFGLPETSNPYRDVHNEREARLWSMAYSMQRIYERHLKEGKRHEREPAALDEGA